MFDVGYVGSPARIEREYRKGQRRGTLGLISLATAYTLFWFSAGAAFALQVL